MKFFLIGRTLTHYIHTLNLRPAMPRIRKSKYAVSHSATHHNCLLTQRPANEGQLPAALRSSTRSPRAGKNPERQRRVTPPGNRVRFPTLTLVLPHSDGEYCALLEKPKDPGIPNNFPYKDQILAEIAEERRQVRFTVVQSPSM
jgi:hypothetical protein